MAADPSTPVPALRPRLPGRVRRPRPAGLPRGQGRARRWPRRRAAEAEREVERERVALRAPPRRADRPDSRARGDPRRPQIGGAPSWSAAISSGSETDACARERRAELNQRRQRSARPGPSDLPPPNLERGHPDRQPDRARGERRRPSRRRSPEMPPAPTRSTRPPTADAPAAPSRAQARPLTADNNGVRLALRAPAALARGPLDVRLLLHRTAHYPVVTLVVGTPGGDARPATTRACLTALLDIGAEADRAALTQLAKKFALAGRHRRARPPAAPGEADRAARRERRRTSCAPPTITCAGSPPTARPSRRIARARDLVLGAGYDLLGVEHPEAGEFRDDKLAQLETAQQVRRAIAIARRFARPSREDYLVCARGYPAAALARAAPARARARGRVGPVDGPRARAGRGLRGARAVAPRSRSSSSIAGFEALRTRPGRVRHRRRRRRRQPQGARRGGEGARRRAARRQAQRRDRERGRRGRLGLDRAARRRTASPRRAADRGADRAARRSAAARRRGDRAVRARRAARGRAGDRGGQRR